MKTRKTTHTINKKNTKTHTTTFKLNTFKLIEHNVLEKTHLATLNKITNTPKYKQLFNLFTHTGLLLYYLLDNHNTHNTIIGYIFIGKVDNNKYTIT